MALPDIKEKFADWYQEVIYQAELADQAPVRGCFVIRPYGYAIWELIRAELDRRIKETGHQNAAFPLLIPESFLKREAEHVEGFAPEVAVVTYAGGKKLEEPLVIRPTSETIVHYMFAKWIKSWRDLPLKINQWANIVRWEMRPRAFLRTTEFFWQEGHTAHETKKEAEAEAELMWKEYINLAHNFLAIPAIAGIKTEQEKFPGAEKTYTFEALMPDGKAVQMGTSHIISQSFAQAFNMQYQDREGNLQYPYLTSWGATTRLIGAVIMVHGDQKGLILPPKVAPIQLVIVPIFKAGIDNKPLLDVVEKMATQLKKQGIRVYIDTDEHKTPGAKFYWWELKGVPLRLELGTRDLEKGVAVIVDRVTLEKKLVPLAQVEQEVVSLLAMVQQHLFIRAQKKLESLWFKKEKLTDFGSALREKGGLYQTGWCKDPVCENKLKEYQGSIRCILDTHEFKQCFNCNKKSVVDVLVAKSY
jgi:prolyl-tRNA synthetase